MSLKPKQYSSTNSSHTQKDPDDPDEEDVDEDGEFDYKKRSQFANAMKKQESAKLR